MIIKQHDFIDFERVQGAFLFLDRFEFHADSIVDITNDGPVRREAIQEKTTGAVMRTLFKEIGLEDGSGVTMSAEEQEGTVAASGVVIEVNFGQHTETNEISEEAIDAQILNLDWRRQAITDGTHEFFDHNPERITDDLEIQWSQVEDAFVNNIVRPEGVIDAIAKKIKGEGGKKALTSFDQLPVFLATCGVADDIVTQMTEMIPGIKPGGIHSLEESAVLGLYQTILILQEEGNFSLERMTQLLEERFKNVRGASLVKDYIRKDISLEGDLKNVGFYSADPVGKEILRDMAREYLATKNKIPSSGEAADDYAIAA